MKRAFDLILALVAFVLLLPVTVVIGAAIWSQDRKSPFYVANRVGRKGIPFRMVKFRSMVVNADRLGGASTAGDDRRITALGAFIRRYKIDELPQLWNIIVGEMSFVGPRPNVLSDVALYSEEERGLLAGRPGITDLSSIVFADEAEILRGSRDPDLTYNLVIRPWKSRLGLHYLRTRTVLMDMHILWLTGVAIATRPRALAGVQRILQATGAEPVLIVVAGRTAPLADALPPGVTRETWAAHLPTRVYPAAS
jgi:lipopolysaccharide/colanic/teichoic acid biosynthesis glycosyltransferase